MESRVPFDQLVHIAIRSAFGSAMPIITRLSLALFTLSDRIVGPSRTSRGTAAVRSRPYSPSEPRSSRVPSFS